MESRVKTSVSGYAYVAKGVPEEHGQDEGEKQGKKPRKQTCVVPGCGPTNRLVHKIPKNNPLRGIWIQALGLQSGEVKKTSRICEIHFAEGAYVPGNVPGTKCLIPGAVPCFPNGLELWNQSKTFVHNAGTHVRFT